jgi:hypothetical protein
LLLDSRRLLVRPAAATVLVGLLVLLVDLTDRRATQAQATPPLRHTKKEPRNRAQGMLERACAHHLPVVT